MKSIVKCGILLAVCALTLSSCNCFKKMAKNQDRISVVANPEILTLVGGNIVADVTVVFPEEYYNPKAIVRITPMLVFDGGIIEGAPKYFQGEKVKDNYTVISKASGGVFSQQLSFPWDPRARRCILELKVEGKCKADADFVLAGVIPVAEGVNTLQQDLSYADVMLMMPDNFKRVTHETEAVNIMYQVSRSNVRDGELSKEQTRLFEAFIRDNENRERVTLGNIQARGYASPEGPEGFNEELSLARSQSGRRAIEDQLRGTSVRYDVAAFGEDWEGFKELVEASDMKDKAMIVQVLNMYSSAAQRDIEIRNMSAVFEELKEKILPELRRTQVFATTDIQGKSDDELMDAVRGNLSSLNLEETLFAATLFSDDAERVRIYRSAADRFNDPRAWNNLGVTLAARNEWAAAENAFNKATALSSNPAMANNLALAAMAQGKVAEAAKYLPAASAEARALAEVSGGKYGDASRALEGYNKAVADVLDGNLSAAKNALEGDTSARADYLRAVIAAKEGDLGTASVRVKTAIIKDPSLKEKALGDVNLREIAERLQ